MESAKPLTTTDLRELHEWADNLATEANGWAERAEVSRGERADLTTHLDVLASRARYTANLTAVLLDR